MIKYLALCETKEIPRHRFINYWYFLDSKQPTSEDEYINRICEQWVRYKEWTPENEEEALEGLQWLVDNNLAKVVE